MLVSPGDRSPADTLKLIEAALAGGVTAILLREPRLAAPERAELARRVVAACAATQALCVLSRDAGSAASSGAHGVHCGGGGPDLGATRAAAPGLLVSRSGHWPLEPDAPAADWITLSPFRPTPQSLPRALLDASQVAAVLARMGKRPVVALGGLDLGAVAKLPRALAGLAVRRAITHAADPRAAAAALSAAVDRHWGQAP